MNIVVPSLQRERECEEILRKEYAETRAFYRARGYTPLEVFPTLWSPRNPALQLVKVLDGVGASP